MTVDVRGISETRPLHGSDSSDDNEFGQLFDLETGMAYLAWEMNQSLLGMRVQDVVKSIDYIASRKDVDANQVHVIGKGMGGMWCLYAAAIDPRIRSLISVQSLLSYRALTEVDRYRYGADVFVQDVLLHFDLPQVAAAVTGRSLTLIQPADAMKNPVEANTANEAYAWTSATYQAAGLGNLFQIETEGKASILRNTTSA